MTYFHRRPSTIIGAKAFHDPVRDGKAWDHLAMVVKRKGVLKCAVWAHLSQLGSKHSGWGHGRAAIAQGEREAWQMSP